LVTDTVFVAFGNTPNTEIFKNQIDMDEYSYVRVYNEAKTNVDGVLVLEIIMTGVISRPSANTNFATRTIRRGTQRILKKPTTTKKIKE